MGRWLECLGWLENNFDINNRGKKRVENGGRDMLIGH